MSALPKPLRLSVMRTLVMVLLSASSLVAVVEPSIAQAPAIRRVAWQGIDANDGRSNFEPDGHPTEFGGGDRIFPGRNFPEGTPEPGLPWSGLYIDGKHNLVRVCVELEEAPVDGDTLVVYLRLLDPDHYSDDAWFDPNGKSQPNDNVAAGKANPAKIVGAEGSASLQTKALSVEGDGSETTWCTQIEITAPQPGNNWIVAAGLDEAALAEVTLGKDGKTVLRSKKGGLYEPRTPILTVWRHLYGEIQWMTPTRTDFTTGNGQSVFASGPASRLGADRVRLDLGTGQIGELHGDQFQGGSITLKDDAGGDLGTFPVKANSTGHNPTIVVEGTVPASTASFGPLVDDDDRTLLTEPDTSLWASLLRPALVQPVLCESPYLDCPVESGLTVTFDVHIGDQKKEANNAKELIELFESHAAQRTESEPWFWVAYQVGAFQGPGNSSLDPDQTAKPRPDGDGTMGWAMATGLGGVEVSKAVEAWTSSGSAVFVETIRDFVELKKNQGKNPRTTAELKALVSIHEVGHLFGTEDRGSFYGTLYAYNKLFFADTPIESLKLSGVGLRAVMTTSQPGYNHHGPSK